MGASDFDRRLDRTPHKSKSVCGEAEAANGCGCMVVLCRPVRFLETQPRNREGERERERERESERASEQKHEKPTRLPPPQKKTQKTKTTPNKAKHNTTTKNNKHEKKNIWTPLPTVTPSSSSSGKSRRPTSRCPRAASKPCRPGTRLWPSSARCIDLGGGVGGVGWGGVGAGVGWGGVGWELGWWGGVARLRGNRGNSFIHAQPQATSHKPQATSHKPQAPHIATYVNTPFSLPWANGIGPLKKPHVRPGPYQRLAYFLNQFSGKSAQEVRHFEEAGPFDLGPVKPPRILVLLLVFLENLKGVPSRETHLYCGWTKSCTTLKPLETIVQGNHQSRFLRWCETDFAHPQH